MSFFLRQQLFCFACVGVLAASVNFLVVIGCVSVWGWPPLLANIVAFLVAFQVSFFGHQRWTFKQTSDAPHALPKFFVVALLSFLLNEGLYTLFLKGFHMDYQLGLLLVLLIVPIVTFVMSRLWAFR